MARPTMKTPEDFWARVDTSGDGCWLWGKRYTGTYGTAFYAGKFYVAHRLAYLLGGGRLTPTLDVHHHCHNPQCIRPDHLAGLTRSQHKLEHPPSRHWGFSLISVSLGGTEHEIPRYGFRTRGEASVAGKWLRGCYPTYRLEVYRTDPDGNRLPAPGTRRLRVVAG